MKTSASPKVRTSFNGFTTIKPPVQVPGGWRLESSSGRVAGAVIFGILAVGWNGVVWTKLIGSMKSTETSDWILTIVLSVFAFIGVALAALFVVMLLKALYTPKPTIELSSETVDPLRATQLRWSFTGSKPLLDLRITLVLREETQYRRGTDTVTDQHQIREVVLYDRPEPPRDGTLSLTIPAGLPPSFSTKSNQLVWCLRLRGSVPRLPDVDDEFPLIVRPAILHPASIQVTRLPEGTILPEGTPPLSLAGGASPGAAVAGVVHVPGKSVVLRLRWSTNGKGDNQSEIASEAPVTDGVGGFILTMPSLPPAWSGTVLSITWTLQAVVDSELIAALILPSLAQPSPAQPATDVVS